jgi:GTPase SAR1 family protein
MIQTLKTIEEIVERNHDLIGDDAEYQKRNFGITDAAEIEKHIAAIADENRLLTIGIIGRVNAGKSSLTNSLFFNGESVLPEAPTPMTAALTVLSYDDVCSVKANFFLEEDIEIIKREHREFTEASNDMLKERKKASFEQYEQMKASGVDIDSICKQKEETIEADNFADLKSKLEAFVGASGKYTAFTKSVEITTNNPALKDVCIVDTPGINDPVKSREARTEQYLSKCDVVFIVSQAGQFMSEQDLELMDRLSTREGVRELFLAASMADNILNARSVAIKAAGDLQNAISAGKEKLLSQAKNSLTELKTRHPEIKDQFDKLIEEGENRFVLTSGLCNAMYLRYEQKDTWSDSMKGIMTLLQRNYPDYFDESSGKASLELLGNVAVLRQKLETVRELKEKIIAEKIEDYSTRQNVNIGKYRSELITAIESRIEKIKSSDLQSLEAEIIKLDNFISAGQTLLDIKLRDTIDGAQRNLKDKLNANIDKITRTVNASIESETEIIDGKDPKEGFFNGLARLLGALLPGMSHLGYDIFKRTELRAGAVKRTINEGILQFNSTIGKIVNDEISIIKDTLPEDIKKIFKETDTERILDPQFLHRAVYSMTHDYAGGILWNIDAPVFEYPAMGVITDNEIGNFEAAWMSFIRGIQKTYTDGIQSLLNTIETNKAAKNPSAYIFSNLKTQMKTLKKDLNKKQTALEQLTQAKNSLRESD